MISEGHQHENENSWVDDEPAVLDLPSSFEQEFDQYIKYDDNLECYGDKTDDDIIQEIVDETSKRACEEESDSDGEKNAEDSSIPLPVTVQEAIKALGIVAKFLKFYSVDTEEVEKVEEKIYKISRSNLTQKKITDYYY